MKKIFTVSLVAIMAATAANADIASTKYVMDRTGTTANLTTTAKELTGAVNELKTKLDTVAGDSTTSVGEQITAAKTELQGKIDDVAGDLADYEAANDKALEDGLALKQDVANLAKAITEGMNKETSYPSVSLMEKTIADSNNLIGDEIADLTQTVTNNKSAADTGIQEAKDAAAQALADAKADATSKADKALADAKTYADTQDAAQTTTITNAYKAADTALETSLKKYADDAAAVATGDASEVAGELAEYISSNNTAVAAAKKAGDDAQADLNAYKTSNNTAVAAAKKAGDDAQADLDAYKTSNNAAVAKAQTDAVASAKTYTDGEIDKVEAAYAAADTALETSLQSYADQAEADAIAAAKTAGDAAYAAKSYEAIVNADKAFRESITAGTEGSDGTYALTATVSNGSVSGYKWEQIGR